MTWRAIVWWESSKPTLYCHHLIQTRVPSKDPIPLPDFHSRTAAESEVVITGLGMMTPLAAGREESWRRLLNGDVAGRILSADDIEYHAELVELLGRVPGGAPADHALISRRIDESDQAFVNRSAVSEFRHDALNNLMLASAAEALEHADLPVGRLVPERTGCVIGSSKPSFRAMSKWFELHGKSEREGVDDQIYRSAFLADTPLRAVMAMTGAAGPAECPVAACATGLLSVIIAADYIRSGDCDVCVAGSADASLCAPVLASFHRLGVTSKNTDPATACRPFDAARDGFIIGEGAAAVVLESRAHAAARNKAALARVAGSGWLTDVTGITQIDSSGQVVAQVLKQLQRASGGKSAAALPLPDFFGLHGTATVTNDLAEANGLGRLGASDVPCFGTKGATGHLLGAAGIVELGTTLLALRDGILPPTANLHNPDSACRLNVRNAPLRLAAGAGLKLSLGFGGHVAACLVQNSE